MHRVLYFCNDSRLGMIKVLYLMVNKISLGLINTAMNTHRGPGLCCGMDCLVEIETLSALF